MKIGIDIQSTVGRRTGIGQYTRSLVEELKRAEGAEFVLYADNDRTSLDTVQRMWWENVSLPDRIRKSKVDLFHIPGFAGPMKKGGCRKVTTVHDLIGMIYPENLGVFSRFYWKSWLPACVRNSDAVICESLHTKRDIMRLLGIPEEKINVVFLAADAAFRPIHDAEALEKVRKKYGLPRRFVLNVGSVEPRKNICGLVEAFSLYAKEKDSDLCLAMVGKKDWGYAQAAGKAAEKGLSERVFFTDYVEDADLPFVYNMCEFFIFPSFYEGFGLPVLEAMACARPVICSNASSLPEVGADAAVYVDPSSAAEMSAAIKRLDEDASLREAMAQRSLRRASAFSWKGTASGTLEVYRKVLGGK